MPDSAVPTLRAALKAARRLGATVEPVHATGEVRVIAGSSRLTINARRKDATRELAQLVVDLERVAQAAPKPQATPIPIRATPPDTTAPPAPIVRHTVTISQRLRAYIGGLPTADPDGWHRYDAREIADALGMRLNQVQVFVADAQRRGELEARRRNPDAKAGTGAPIEAIRFARAVDAGKAEAAGMRDYRDQPLRVVGPAPIPGEDAPEALGMLPVPKLAAYAAAVKLVRESELLKVEPDEKQLAEILHDAVRLYFWARAGGGR